MGVGSGQDGATEAVRGSVFSRLFIAEAQVQAFADWLCLGLREQYADWTLWRLNRGGPLDEWTAGAYSLLVPPGAEEPERQLFFSDMELILATYRQDLGSTDAPDWRILRLMEAACGRCCEHDLSLQGLASELQLRVSPAWIGRLFRRRTGLSFHRYLHLLRMCRAARLLRCTGKNVKEISAEAGYTDPANFGREFHDEFGISAGKWGARSRLCSGER